MVQIALNIIITGSLYAILALGFNLTYSCARFINFSFGSFAVVGGYTAFAALKYFHLPIFVAVILGMLTAGLFAMFIEYFLYSPIRSRKASKLILFVASIGVFALVESLVSIFFGTHFEVFSLFLSSGRGLDIGSAHITEIQLVIFACALLCGGLTWFFFRTKWGKVMLAISDDEYVAQVVGIQTGKVLRWVFFLSGALGGLAGILWGFDIGIEPTMGLILFLAGVISAIIGGAGVMWAGFLGAFLLATIEQISIWSLGGDWRQAVVYIVLAVVLLLKPQGLFRK